MPKTVKYQHLPKSDIKVSKICLGTMTYGQQNSEPEAHEQMSYAFDQGVNFFDTAEIYPFPIDYDPSLTGATERIIGSWLKKTGHRDKIVIASKIVGPGANTAHVRTSGYSPEAIKQALEGSLKRLQTDYVDLYQLHWPMRKTNCFGVRGYQNMPDEDPWKDDFRETLHTLGGLIKEGKIRQIGLSNETAWGVMRCLQEAEYHKMPRMITVQNPYSLLNRLYEEALAEIGLREGVGLLAYSPLAFGMLTGKYLNGRNPPKARLTIFPNSKRYRSESCAKATQLYYEVAQKHGLSFAQMALAFVNTRPFLTSSIIGATTIGQLKENIDSINVDLSKETLADIEAVHLKMPSPAC